MAWATNNAAKAEREKCSFIALRKSARLKTQDWKCFNLLWFLFFFIWLSAQLREARYLNLSPNASQGPVGICVRPWNYLIHLLAMLFTPSTVLHLTWTILLTRKYNMPSRVNAAGTFSLAGSSHSKSVYTTACLGIVKVSDVTQRWLQDRPCISARVFGDFWQPYLQQAIIVE